MRIHGVTNIKITTFNDLKKGDIFYFLKDAKEITDITNLNNQKIYMRCGHGQNDKDAVNLATGICYGFTDNEPVEILNATLNIEV